jgi:hypothetical protein
MDSFNLPFGAFENVLSGGEDAISRARFPNFIQTTSATRRHLRNALCRRNLKPNSEDLSIFLLSSFFTMRR